MKTNQDRQILLDETITHITTNGRCLSPEGVCVYVNDAGNGCAIGRLIQDKDLCRKLDSGMVGIGLSVNNTAIFAALPEDLKEYGQYFLADLQKLHDSSALWDDKELKAGGYTVIELIRDNIVRGFYDIRN